MNRVTARKWQGEGETAGDRRGTATRAGRAGAHRARIGAWLIALFLVAVTPMLHNFWTVADPMMRQIQMAMFMKNVSMLGAALFITQVGSGPWSLDSRKK
jgi:hypothetical protein